MVLPTLEFLYLELEPEQACLKGAEQSKKRLRSIGSGPGYDGSTLDKLSLIYHDVFTGKVTTLNPDG